MSACRRQPVSRSAAGSTPAGGPVLSRRRFLGAAAAGLTAYLLPPGVGGRARAVSDTPVLHPWLRSINRWPRWVKRMVVAFLDAVFRPGLEL